MENLTNPSFIKPIMQKHGFDFSKKLGQNFIINSHICPKIADFADLDGGVIEIGPGVGVLTNELAKRAKKVVALEIDERLIPVLKETLSDHENVEVVCCDAMKTDLKALVSEKFGSMPVSVCANLPYYITSPIIMMLLESGLPLTSITVMVQKEAAKRLCAEMPGRQCGAITASVNYYGEPEYLFEVSRGSFMPAPNVDSAVIKITLKKRFSLDNHEEKELFSFIKAAFSQRRKTLPNSLSSQLALSAAQISEILISQGFKPNIRAEELSLADMVALSKAISNYK